MYALARNDKTAGGVEPRPYAAFVVTGAVIVRADRVVRPYKMFDEPDAASPRRTFFPPDGKKRDALRPAPHKKTYGFACAYLAKMRPKKVSYTSV